jgi:transcription elongation factor Elf1
MDYKETINLTPIEFVKQFNQCPKCLFQLSVNRYWEKNISRFVLTCHNCDDNYRLIVHFEPKGDNND